MEPRIALILAHPYTREAVAFATRTMHNREPIWELDPSLQETLWSFTEKIAEYASGYRFSLEQVAEYARYTMVLEQLPNLRLWIDEAHQNIRRQFSQLQGVEQASGVYDCLMRIAHFTAIVAQCQRAGIEPERFLEK